MSLTALIYGGAGSGKTPILATMPGRALLIAPDNGHRHLRSRPRHVWRPRTEKLPTKLEPDALVVAVTQTWDDALSALDVLVSGKHDFESVGVDTITAMQNRVIDMLTNGTGDMSQQLWGRALRTLGGYTQTLVDLVEHPARPLTVVAATAQLDDTGDEYRPELAGSLQGALIEMFDLFGYVGIRSDFDGDAYPGPEDRRMVVSPGFGVQARDRTVVLPNGGIAGNLGAKVSGPIDLAALAALVN